MQSSKHSRDQAQRKDRWGVGCGGIGVRERTSFKSELGLLGKEPVLSQHVFLGLKEARPWLDQAGHRQSKFMGELIGF